MVGKSKMAEGDKFMLNSLLMSVTNWTLPRLSTPASISGLSKSNSSSSPEATTFFTKSMTLVFTTIGSKPLGSSFFFLVGKSPLAATATSMLSSAASSSSSSSSDSSSDSSSSSPSPSSSSTSTSIHFSSSSPPPSSPPPDSSTRCSEINLIVGKSKIADGANDMPKALPMSVTNWTLPRLSIPASMKGVSLSVSSSVAATSFTKSITLLLTATSSRPPFFFPPPLETSFFTIFFFPLPPLFFAFLPFLPFLPFFPPFAAFSFFWPSNFVIIAWATLCSSSPPCIVRAVSSAF
mmetsp:Transcript_459/g.758  ORF Transcript_459/g.758 Transcript_459/m.758 type:complete len:293 (-) Transcript_459:379-1257(-)